MKYLDLIDGDNQARCKKMWDFFKESCADAKGSSSNHQSWEGGYFDHITDIMEYGVSLYELLSKVDKLPFSISDVILVLFLHDIEKPIKYGTSNKLQISNDDIRKSLIFKYEIELNIEHINALKYIHGEGNDYSSSNRVMNPLSAFCHCCDIISARIFFDHKPDKM